jgi:glycosyltransferase EpsE
MEFPLVSFIYPAYNDAPNHIRESMVSILEQDYPNIEVIVIDDSTEAGTIDALNRYALDPRVTILRQTERLGLPKSLNNGLAVARGKYIARADADDIQHPSRLSTQIDFLEKNPGIGIVGSNVNYVNPDGNYIKTRTYPETSSSIRRYIHMRNPLCNPVVTIRRAVFNQIGFYDTDFLRSEDYELWFRANASNILMYNIQEVLLNYRVASAAKRDKLNWEMTLSLKKKYFSSSYPFESLIGIISVYLYTITPLPIQHFIYKRLV